MVSMLTYLTRQWSQFGERDASDSDESDPFVSVIAPRPGLMQQKKVLISACVWLSKAHYPPGVDLRQQATATYAMSESGHHR